MSDRHKSKKQARKVNRSQRKAREVRLAESQAPAPIDMAVAIDQPELVDLADTSPVQASRRTRPRAVQQIQYVLPRQVEYAYIRSDIRRLVFTAAALFILMFALLFVLD
ncbi:MAG: hypothetical protein KC438_10490 [Thermomicrobiales bacterium]|nr:hypothetical protein [Thermomicrobiales bacterium]MCO5222353.1 hypothetical protein [Thermomicrobiales bacterium]